MNTYEPLTKETIDDNNNQIAVCRFYGTGECLIHKQNGCNNCPVFKAILTQLNVFEKIYMEDDDES